MKKSNYYSTSSHRQKYYYLLTIIFVVAYYFLIVFNNSRITTMDLEFTADTSDSLNVFWPDAGNNYNELQSRTIEYSAGLNTLRVTIPYFPRKLNLRFDPATQQNQIKLHQLSFTRSGRRFELNPEQIAESILAVNSIKWHQSEDKLVLNLENNDPIIVLKRLPFPSSTRFLLSSLLSLIALASLFRWLNRPAGTHSAQYTIITFIVLIILYWIARSSAHESLYQALLIHALPVLAMVHIVLLVERRKPAESRFKYAGSLLVIVLFLSMMHGQMLISLTPETINKVKTNTEDSFSENREKGFIEALKMARDTFENSLIESLQAKDNLLILNAESKIFVLGFALSGKAIVGKDGWFFEGYGDRRVEKEIVQSFDNITDYMGQNPFTGEELETWRITLEERYYWLKERGSKYIFALAPTKALVYPEKLPERILRMKKKLNKPTRYDQLISYLKKNSIVPVVDLRKDLLEEKDVYPDVPLFYRTDFHWNYFGSFFAYRAIINGINQAYPDLKLVAGELQEFNVKKKTDWVHVNFMGLVGLDPNRHKNDTYFTLHPKPESNYFRISDFSVKGINDHSVPDPVHRDFGQTTFSVREINNPNGDLPLIFIIGDSFIEKTLGYFSMHGKEVLNFRVVTSFPVAPYTEAGLKPDIVVQEILNMYLLKSPPGNPDGVKAARVRALEKNNN